MADSDDDSCFTCCCSPCIGLCYLFCLRSMTVSTRLKIVWLWMIFLSLFSGLYIRYNLYATDTVLITSYDMMPVQKMSTFFCQGVTVGAESVHPPLAVYRLNSQPRINHTHTVHNSSMRLFLERNMKKLFHFYLMAGSSITLSFCTKLSLTLTVIKGAEKYENYLLTLNYRKYTENFMTIPSGCSLETFDIHNSERYYFLIGQNWRKSTVYLQIVLSVTSYEVHGEDSQLQNILPEVFVPLKFQSTETIVYQPSVEKYQEINVTTRCEPINYLYVGLFLGGFLALGLILSYFVKCLSKDPIPDPIPSTELPNHMSITEPTPTDQIHPTAPPLPVDESATPWLPEPRMVPSCPPPAYESLFANTADNEPPSYLSTTLELNKK